MCKHQGDRLDVLVKDMTLGHTQVHELLQQQELSSFNIESNSPTLENFMTLLIFGFAIRLESKNIPLIVQDFNRTNISNSYIERLYATNQFMPTQWSGNDPVRDAIDRGIAYYCCCVINY